MHLGEAAQAAINIQDKFQLDQVQQTKLTTSTQLEHILSAALWLRWDQVTLMLYQDDILEKKQK